MAELILSNLISGRFDVLSNLTDNTQYFEPSDSSNLGSLVLPQSTFCKKIAIDVKFVGMINTSTVRATPNGTVSALYFNLLNSSGNEIIFGTPTISGTEFLNTDSFTCMSCGDTKTHEIVLNEQIKGIKIKGFMARYSASLTSGSMLNRIHISARLYK